MIKTLAGFTMLAALLAACSEPRTGPGVSGGSPGVTTTASLISMTPTSAVAGAQVTFTGWGLFDHEDYSRSWDFGDGATAEGLSVTHIYERAGAYQVVLVGCDGVTTRTATLTVNVASAEARTLPPPQEVRQP